MCIRDSAYTEDAELLNLFSQLDLKIGSSSKKTPLFSSCVAVKECNSKESFVFCISIFHEGLETEVKSVCLISLSKKDEFES